MEPVPSSIKQTVTTYSSNQLHDSHTSFRSQFNKPAVLSAQYHVVRRNGKTTHFDAGKINVAITKAFLAVEGGHAAASRRVHELVEQLVQQVLAALQRRNPHGGTVHIEDIQDQVELALMRAGEHKVARAYVLYREQQAKQRQALNAPELDQASAIRVTLLSGEQTLLASLNVEQRVLSACESVEHVDANAVLDAARHQFYDAIPINEVHQALILTARTLIEQEPNYTYVTARLLLHTIQQECASLVSFQSDDISDNHYAAYFKRYIAFGVQQAILDPILQQFNLDTLVGALQPQRDMQFTYLGLQTLYDRYLLHHEGTRFEMPQAFFMRVAMGLALHETDREARAIEFYELISSFDFMCSTPTLFNAGTLRPQLSSCYLTTVQDDLKDIYDAMRNNALLSKYAGGLGNDWTPVRALGAHIKGTNGKSQGVVPFLKVVNDTAVAVNQGGKRKGAVCAYLETWHLDIEEFLELRKNTGDERRRTHDMNSANWIPDLFMRRVINDEQWTLFSPDDCPDLHDTYGEKFEQLYARYEQQARDGLIKNTKTLSAVSLWRKMLGMLYETGHPWITFKDACNIRSPQQHTGVVHSSNLCTEITLNTSSEEIAVCNLGSVNLARHVRDGELDFEKLQRTVNTAMRMLDNVIDINFYSVSQARTSNLRHRPVGLGIMGFQDVLQQLSIAYDSEQALELADISMEGVSYFAINASSELAKQRGAYSSYHGSMWSQGLLPIDSIATLREARSGELDMDTAFSGLFDWQALRKKIQLQGMRNSNCLAIAPTATISNICGVSQSIEPTFQNLFVKSNLSGEFTVVNPYLVQRLKEAHLWDGVMVNDLKYFNGSVQHIDRCPNDIKALFKCAFEIDATWLVKAASRRQKWIDQSQSLNLYIAEPSGKKLDHLYKLAWRSGLKTTYYLRSLAATRSERATVEDNALNAVHIPQTEASKVCAIGEGECEACQ